jgi:hypothetical protein
MQSTPTDEPPSDPADPSEPVHADGVEYLGTYASLEAYLRAIIEPEIAPGLVWLLDHLDYEAVVGRFENGRYRYFWEHGHVYRGRLPDADDE